MLDGPAIRMFRKLSSAYFLRHAFMAGNDDFLRAETCVISQT